MPCAYCILHMPNMDFGSRSHAGGELLADALATYFLGRQTSEVHLAVGVLHTVAADLLARCDSLDGLFFPRRGCEDDVRGPLRGPPKWRAEQNTRTMLRAKKPRLRPWHRKPKVGILADMRNSHHVLLHHVLQRNSGSHQDTHQCDARRPTTIYSPGPHQVETPYSSTREVE